MASFAANAAGIATENGLPRENFQQQKSETNEIAWAPPYSEFSNFMAERPPIYFLFSTHNQADQLKCFPPILNAAEAPTWGQVILVDNGSIDTTLENP